MAFTNRDLQKNSPRAAVTAEGLTQGEKSMRTPTLLHPLETPPVDLRDNPPRTITTAEEAEAPELVDNGRRLAMVEEDLALAPALERRREPLDPETAERVADCLATARQEFIGAMKRLELDREQDGAADLHVRIALMAIDVDDLLALLAERWAS